MVAKSARNPGRKHPRCRPSHTLTAVRSGRDMAPLPVLVAGGMPVSSLTLPVMVPSLLRASRPGRPSSADIDPLHLRDRRQCLLDALEDLVVVAVPDVDEVLLEAHAKRVHLRRHVDEKGEVAVDKGAVDRDRLVDEDAPVAADVEVRIEDEVDPRPPDVLEVLAGGLVPDAGPGGPPTWSPARGWGETAPRSSRWTGAGRSSCGRGRSWRTTMGVLSFLKWSSDLPGP